MTEMIGALLGVLGWTAGVLVLLVMAALPLLELFGSPR
jgi:hypothetical protein